MFVELAHYQISLRANQLVRTTELSSIFVPLIQSAFSIPVFLYTSCMVIVWGWLAPSSKLGPGVCSWHGTASALGCKSKELDSTTFCKEDVKDKIADIQWYIV